MSVPVRFTAAPQDAESVQRNGVKNVDAGVLPVQYQQRFRVFGTGQSLWNRGMGECICWYGRTFRRICM